MFAVKAATAFLLLVSLLATPNEALAKKGKQPPAKLKALIKKGGWKLAAPAQNAQGQWQAIHLKTGVTFILVPGGSFKMGRETGSDEKPVRKVTLKPFLLAKYELSKEVWVRFGGPVYRSGASIAAKEMPISDVTWNEAQAWVKSVALRLPSESEWEYACRAGSTSSLIGAGDAEVDKRSWNKKNSGDKRHLAGKKEPNAWGFYDMCGNTNEWTQDKYDYYSKAPNDGSALEGDAKAMRVYRGGYYATYRSYMSCSYRSRSNPGSRYESPGIRPASSL